MKREREMPGSSASSKVAGSNNKLRTPDKKSKGVGNVDVSSGSTSRVRSKHGHGMNNEGTNVNYEEEK